MTCRCPMCSPKKAGRLRRRSYIEVNIRCDENGSEHLTKRQARKLRRLREKRKLMQELQEDEGM